MPSHLNHSNHHDHHTCCQVPSHVSDAGPGARVVAALKSGQLFAFRQSVNNHEVRMMGIMMMMGVMMMMMR